MCRRSKAPGGLNRPGPCDVLDLLFHLGKEYSEALAQVQDKIVVLDGHGDGEDPLQGNRYRNFADSGKFSFQSKFNWGILDISRALFHFELCNFGCTHFPHAPPAPHDSIYPGWRQDTPKQPLR